MVKQRSGLASMVSLNLSNSSLKVICPRNFLPSSQVSLKPKRQSTLFMTTSTRAGGFIKDFISTMDLLSRFCTAFSAAWRAGSASARFFSQSILSSLTSSFWTAASFASFVHMLSAISACFCFSSSSIMSCSLSLAFCSRMGWNSLICFCN